MSEVVLKVVRFQDIKNATLGTFVLEDGRKSIFGGYTLEPAGPDSVIPNLDRRIPAGAYDVCWHNSPKFKRRLPLLFNDVVSKSRYILIHAGNFGRDTEGCIIVGLSRDDKAVYNSREALNKLLKLIDNREFKVVIV